MENINEILKEDYKLEKSREEGVNPLCEHNTGKKKVYIGVDGTFQSEGIPEDYNGKNARTDEIKELNKMMSP